MLWTKSRISLCWPNSSIWISTLIFILSRSLRSTLEMKVKMQTLATSMLTGSRASLGSLLKITWLSQRKAQSTHPSATFGRWFIRSASQWSSHLCIRFQATAAYTSRPRWAQLTHMVTWKWLSARKNKSRHSSCAEISKWQIRAKNSHHLLTCHTITSKAGKIGSCLRVGRDRNWPP